MISVIRLYAPTEAQYKVIDGRVHMLSTGAFNALLKTAEEPPANVIFILITTEPHKIPATIISEPNVLTLNAFSVNRLKTDGFILGQDGMGRGNALAVIT